MALKTYVIHATCRYVCQNKETKRTESGQNRPTISIDASSEKAAINKATRQQKKAISSEWWPCISFHLIPELVRVIEHATAAQRKVLRRFRDGSHSGANRAMVNRLVDKGWLEGSIADGYVLTAAGRREAD
jgi:macrodomain Ter protein organizer (MatP/YcbG family)